MENLNGTRVTVRGRLSYVHVFKPHASVPGAEEKYSTTVLVPKNDVERNNLLLFGEMMVL